MATAKPAPTPPPAVRSGPKYVKSPGGAGVRPARDRGETAVGGTHCASERKHFQTGTGSGY